jgi:hypothetical protein
MGRSSRRSPWVRNAAAAWHPYCSNLGRTFMKQTNQILKPRQKLSLGDLILAVSSCTKSTKETVAAVADLLGSGQVRLESNGRFTRARVC